MFTKIFNQISKKDANIAGGKGASLGEMTKAKISVPPGFVVLAGGFLDFINGTGLTKKIDEILKKVDYKNTTAVDRASKEIRGLISKSKFPDDIAKEIIKMFKDLQADFVAVRSSATAEDSSSASWAGELESYLNTDAKNLLDNVKKCWSSLFTPRAIFYRFEKKMHKEKVAVAVVVQKMIQSEISGITFTVHPVTKKKDEMVIEAGYGLGEAIVGGKITPDNYVIKKSKLVIDEKYISEQEMMIVRNANGIKETKVPKNISEKQKLTDKQILELAKICINIEKHYKKPQDIEWAIEKGKFYIVQSRPITTL